MDIAGKLRILIEDKGLSQYAFARAAGVTPAYISEILAGKKKPTLDMLEKFCVTLNITLADFFSGGGSRDAADEVVSIDTPSNSMDSGVKVSRRLVSLRESKGHSQYKLAKLSGVPQPMIKRYEDGENQPTIDNLKKLCLALGITLSEFFAEDDPPWTKADVFSSDDPSKYIIGEGTDEGGTVWSTDLPPEAQKELLEYIKYLSYKYRGDKQKK